MGRYAGIVWLWSKVVDTDERSVSSDQQVLTAEEVARRGDAIYAQTIRAQLEPAHEGEIVAVDVISGDYAVDDDTLVAVDHLRARRPNAEVWLIRVGFRSLDRIGDLVNLGHL